MNNARQTARNSLALWVYCASSLQSFCDFVRYRLNRQNQLKTDYYIQFNNKFQQHLIQMGYKRKLFQSNETLLASIRRTYRQLETSRNQYDKIAGKMLRDAYEHPVVDPNLKTDWELMITNNYTPFLFQNPEKVVGFSRNFAEIGYYYKVDLNASVLLDDKIFSKIYDRCCDIIVSLSQYYYVKTFHSHDFMKASSTPVEISLLICFETNLLQEEMYKINFHEFRNYNQCKNELTNLKYFKKTNIKTKSTATGDAAEPETPDAEIDEMRIKWIRPTSMMQSSNWFNDRKNEVGVRVSNYIRYT